MRRNAGFTLAETLITTVLIAIIFVAVVTGITTALNVSKDIDRQSHAQIMFSTAVTELTEDIRNITDIRQASTTDTPSGHEEFYVLFLTPTRGTWVRFNEPRFRYDYEELTEGIELQSSDKTFKLDADAGNNHNLYTRCDNLNFVTETVDDRIVYTGEVSFTLSIVDSETGEVVLSEPITISSFNKERLLGR
jgi:type II secretory pathway pseudopilin PulG